MTTCESTIPSEADSGEALSQPTSLIYIVIVTWNHLDIIQRCLPSALSQTYPSLRIVISDNGSTDGSLEWLSENHQSVQVIENGCNLGFAEGANVGIRHAIAAGAWAVVLLNPDARLEADAIEQLAATAIEHDCVGSVQAKIYLDPPQMPPKFNTCGNQIHYLGHGMCGGFNKPDDGSMEENQQIPFGSGAAVLLLTSTLNIVGLLDSKLFLYHEDFDLGYRMRLFGFENWLSSRAIAYHDYDFQKGNTKFFYIERNRWICLLKTYELRSLLALFPALMFFECGMLLHSLMSGWLGVKLRSYWGVIALSRHWWRERRAIQKVRKVRDREIFQIMTDNLSMPGMERSRLLSFANKLLSAYWRAARWVLGVSDANTTSIGTRRISAP